jgi:hypothetical protein
VHIHNNFFVAPCDVTRASDLQENSSVASFLIPVLQDVVAAESDASLRCLDSDGFTPSSLSAISRFDEKMKNIEAAHPHSNLVFCTSTQDRYQIRLAFLLGCHLILEQGLGFEETYLAFRPLEKILPDEPSHKISMQIALRAFCCAKCMGWIDFSHDCAEGQKHSERVICMDEYDHYARQEFDMFNAQGDDC